MNNWLSYWLQILHPFNLFVHNLMFYWSIPRIKQTTKGGHYICEIVSMTPTNNNFLVTFFLMKDEATISYTWALKKVQRYTWGVQTPGSWKGLGYTWGVKIFQHSNRVCLKPKKNFPFKYGSTSTAKNYFAAHNPPRLRGSGNRAVPYNFF